MSKVCFCIVSGIYPGRSGDDGYVDPPVPIPNTVVKHINAESTWLETAWEDRKLPVKEERHPIGCLFCVVFNPVCQDQDRHLQLVPGYQ